MEKWFTTLVFYFLPHWRLYATPYTRLWKEHERRSFINIIRFSLVVFVLSYLAHHFFVDQPLGLTKEVKWIWYRFGLATSGLFCLFLTYLIKQNTKAYIYKFPVLVLGIIASYFQTQSMIWYSEVPYLWGIVIPVIFASILKMSTLNSLIYCFVIYALQFNHYLLSGLELPMAVGACAMGIAFVAIIKRHMSLEVANFIEQQDKIEVERKLVESKKQMTEQVQGFLPKIINQRISKNIEERKMSVVQAVEEELRPKERMISCLYSDIRSYTQLSKDENFVKDSVFPDTHEAIAIVEEYSGVPRTIGDLVFAYFDDSRIELNVVRTILAANEIKEATELRNKEKPLEQKINRFLIMTVGRAYVGNIGGSGSAREITALGSCVNKSARMDEFTKLEKVKNIISMDGILLDQYAYFILADFVDAKYLKKINLSDIKCYIRDFEDEDSIWFLQFNPSVISGLEKQMTMENNKLRKTAA